MLLGDVGIYALWMCGVRPTVHVAINDQLSWPTIEGKVRGCTKPTGFYGFLAIVGLSMAWEGCKEELPRMKLAQVSHNPSYVTLFVDGPL